MAAVVEIASEAAVAAKSNSNTTTNKNDNNNNLDSERNPKSESEFTVQKLVDMFTKLNPLAKEFFPSSYNKNNPKQFHINNFPVPNKQSANDNFPKRVIPFFSLIISILILNFCFFMCFLTGSYCNPYSFDWWVLIKFFWSMCYLGFICVIHKWGLPDFAVSNIGFFLISLIKLPNCFF